MFVDSVFNIPKGHAEAICKEIIRRRLQVQWSAWFNERFMDDKLIDLAIEAGCRKFEFSPDGYNDKSLKWLNKNIQKKHIEQAYQLIKRKPNIKVEYNFMLGIPGQNIFQLAALALFCIRLKFSLRKRGRINFGKLGIEPGTQLEKIALKEGIILLTQIFICQRFIMLGFLVG